MEAIQGGVILAPGIVVRGRSLAQSVILTKNKEMGILCEQPDGGLGEEEDLPLLDPEWIEEVFRHRGRWSPLAEEDFAVSLEVEPQEGTPAGPHNEGPSEKKKRGKKKQKRSGKSRKEEV